MSTVKIADLPVGTKVRLVFEGEVVERQTRSYPSRTVKEVALAAVDTMNGPHVPRINSMQVSRATTVEVVAPKWIPGDVVVVRYPYDATPYTYVRGRFGWPGESAADKSDAEISRLFAEGKAEHVLRNGKPVPPSVVAPF